MRDVGLSFSSLRQEKTVNGFWDELDLALPVLETWGPPYGVTQGWTADLWGDVHRVSRLL